MRLVSDAYPQTCRLDREVENWIEHTVARGKGVAGSKLLCNAAVIGETLLLEAQGNTRQVKGFKLSGSARELPAGPISISNERYRLPFSSQVLFGISPISELFPEPIFDGRL